MDLADRYLESAELNIRHGNLVPAHNHALHALELAIKAAIVAGGGRHERTHNPAGVFGRAYRGRVPDDMLRRLNRTLDGYDDPRYPGLEHPDPERVRADLEFILRFLRTELPRLLGRPPPGSGNPPQGL